MVRIADTTATWLGGRTGIVAVIKYDSFVVIFYREDGFNCYTYANEFSKYLKKVNYYSSKLGKILYGN